MGNKKVTFDVLKAKDLCPFQKEKGVVLIETKVTMIKNIRKEQGFQVRAQETKQKNARNISDSFDARGWEHSQPRVKVINNNYDPENCEYILVDGYSRFQGAQMSDWETIIVDVVEFETPLDRRRICLKYNEENLPSATNTYEDYWNQIGEAIRMNELEDSEDAVSDFIERSAINKTKSQQGKIIEGWVKRRECKGNRKTWHVGKGTNSVVEYAERNNIPYGGDKNYEKTDMLGIITPHAKSPNQLQACKKAFMKHKKPVHYIMYKEEPANLEIQRKISTKHLDNNIKFEAKYIKAILDRCPKGVPITEELIFENYPVIKDLFIWQNMEKTTEEKGNFVEKGLVDKYGKPSNVWNEIQQIEKYN